MGTWLLWWWERILCCLDFYRENGKKNIYFWSARARARKNITSFSQEHAQGQMQEFVLFVKQMASRFQVPKTRIDLYVLDKLQSFGITFDCSWVNMHIFKIQSHVMSTWKMEKICSHKFLWNNCLANLHCKKPNNFDVCPGKGTHSSETHHVIPIIKMCSRRSPCVEIHFIRLWIVTVNDTSTFVGHAYKK